jgi:hypothetical protein
MGGQMVKQVGHLDPTQIVKAVGVAILAIGKIAAWNSACGPNANKVKYLERANAELFRPKGLKASILSAAQLRERLGMKPDADLALPMEYESTNGFNQSVFRLPSSNENLSALAPTKEEMIAGERAPIRSPHRQILALEKYVTMADLAAEANVAWRSETNRGRKWAGKGIRDWHVYSELNMELARNKAIKLQQKALAQPTEAKKQKGLKAARKADIEVKMVNRNRWLVIEEV